MKMEKLFRIVKKGKKYAVQRKVFSVTGGDRGKGDHYLVRKGLFKHDREFLCDPFSIKYGELNTKWEFAEHEEAPKTNEDIRKEDFLGSMSVLHNVQTELRMWMDFAKEYGAKSIVKTYKTKKEATEALQRIMRESVETAETLEEEKKEWEVV